MKVLMFGWEFPPHISGGLGTACFGLTKALAGMKDLELSFVVPKKWGNNVVPGVRLIGADEVQLVEKQLTFPDASSKIAYYELKSELIPYLGSSEFYELNSELPSNDNKLIELTADGHVILNGGYGMNLFQEVRYYALVAETLAQELDFDLIHVHDWMTFQAGLAVKTITGKPLVLHIHSTEFDRSGYHVNPEICRIEREACSVADQIITVSNFTSDIVCRNYHVDKQKVKTIYNASDPSVHRENTGDPRNASPKVVAFLGRITFQKGPEYFIDAASLVLEKTKNVRFVMAGKGDLRDAMMKRAAQLNILEYIEFPGFIPDEEVPAFFRKSDIFVMPSVSEPFGIVVLEAMQAGLPVVISKQSGVSEILENVLKFDYWDVQGLAASIDRLLEDDSFRASLAANCKAEAEQIFWKDRAESLVEIYRDLIPE